MRGPNSGYLRLPSGGKRRKVSIRLSESGRFGSLETVLQQREGLTTVSQEVQEAVHGEQGGQSDLNQVGISW